MLTDVVEKIVLAVLQGFTEVFPVSSSAHLAVYGSVLGIELSFDKIVLFHLGTFCAILYFYRKDVAAILTGQWGWKIPSLMLLSFATTAIIGFVVVEVLSASIVQQPRYIAVLWIVNGLIMAFVGARSGPGVKGIRDIGLREYLIIGVAQGVAALPGISRLGLTLGAGLLQRMTWSEALKLSFLLSLPTILAANLVELFWLIYAGSSGPDTYGSLVSQLLADILFILPAAGCGLLALTFLSKFLGRRLLIYFGIYCLAAGSFFWMYLHLS
jgi:undecaprenyl-diphosphatase